MAEKVTQMRKNTKSEWQKAVDNFNKKKLKEPVFLNTDLDHTDADILLEDNDHNRHLMERFVKRYHQFMVEDKWQLNGECIKISSDGKLLDGQHRLEALKRYGKPVRMSMAIGVAEDTFAVNDTGKSRDAGDILAIAGYKNVTANAAALRWLLWYQQSESFGSTPDVSPMLVLEAIKKWPHIQHFVYPAVEVGRFLSNSQIQFFMYVSQTIDPELSYDFFEKLQTGEKLTKTSPILMLREYLIKLHMQKMRLDKRHSMASLIITWNAYIEGTRLKTIRWDGRSFPVITGVDRKKLFQKGSGFSAKHFEE